MVIELYFLKQSCPINLGGRPIHSQFDGAVAQTTDLFNGHSFSSIEPFLPSEP
jgi:hypothetical protein